MTDAMTENFKKKQRMYKRTRNSTDRTRTEVQYKLFVTSKSDPPYRKKRMAVMSKNCYQRL
jgi:hypothetical protein